MSVTDSERSYCRACGAAIVWAETSSGKMMPVDAAAHARGKLHLVREDGVLRVKVVGASELQGAGRAL